MMVVSAKNVNDVRQRFTEIYTAATVVVFASTIFDFLFDLVYRKGTYV